MKKILTIFLFYCFINLNFVANAVMFDFSKDGNEDANKILNEFVEKKFQDLNHKSVAYFYDINNDNKNEVIGIVKSQFFYTLSGYRLFVLRKSNSNWEFLKNDIYFDETKEFEIEKNKITYYKTIFFENKKCKAKIKNNKIKTSKTIFDSFKNKKARDIEEITKFSEGCHQNELKIEDFHLEHKKSVNINYKNLNEKTKHYIDLK